VSSNPFEDLDSVRLAPETLAHLQREQAKAGAGAKVSKSPSTRRRIVGAFYLVPEHWLDRAAAAIKSHQQLMVAIRLYRRWHRRNPDESSIVASNVALTGTDASHHVKRRAVLALEKVGLLRILSRGNGRAPRVMIVEQDANKPGNERKQPGHP
jgi:hypothetical protein